MQLNFRVLRLTSLAFVCSIAVATCGCKSADPVADNSPATAPTKGGAGATSSDAAGVVGKWVIDMKLSAQIPAAQQADVKKAADASFLTFSKDGSYKESMMGFEASGNYKVQGSKVELQSTASGGKGQPEVAEFDAKKGTLTFMPGPKRVVFVRGKN